MSNKLNLSAEEVNTYPEMNEHIKGLLRMKDNDPVSCYALARILELEEMVRQLAELDKKNQGIIYDLERQ